MPVTGAVNVICRVCVVSDRPASGQSLARALTGDDLDGEWVTLAALLRRGAGAADVVVLHATGRSADVARRVVDIREGLLGPVVVVTPDSRESTIVQPLAAGARGVVLRTSEAAVLRRAVRAVRDGGTFIDPVLGATLAGLVAMSARTEGATDLTPAELRVLQRFPQGLTNAAIAEDLGVSVNTVKTHVRHILTKLGCDDRVAAVRLAKQHGLIA